MLKNAKRNWKTTLAGIATLALVGAQGVMNPISLLNPDVLGQAVVGVGLIWAKDGNKTGTADSGGLVPQPRSPI